MHSDAPLVDDAVMVNGFAHEPSIGSADVIDAPAWLGFSSRAECEFAMGTVAATFFLIQLIE